MRNWLKDKWIVLSGASSGIGRALVKILIKKYGACVYGIGRSEEKMLSLKAELGENANRFSYALFDVGQKSAWQVFVERLKTENILPVFTINNAGVFPSFGRLQDLGSETVENVLQTNFLSAVYAAETLLPYMQGGGMLNICSSSALCPVVGTAAYSASKSALKGFTEALALEYRGRAYVGIFFPGTTNTELFRNDEQTKDSILQKFAISPEKMAKRIARKLYRRRRRAVLGADAKAMAFITWLMPVKGPALISWVMKKSGSKVFKNVFPKDS
jgi:short-subunit dehydrogenase